MSNKLLHFYLGRKAYFLKNRSLLYEALEFILLSVLLVLWSCGQKRLDYPAAQKVDVAEDYHGVKVADPYRRLEDADAEDTRAGHGAAMPTAKRIKEAEDLYAFLFKVFGMGK